MRTLILLAGCLLLMPVQIRAQSFLMPYSVGGNGKTIDNFTYNGESAADCLTAHLAGDFDVCRNGTCTGTTPNGTCTLNSTAIGCEDLHVNVDTPPPPYPSACLNVLDFALYGGTLTMDGTGTEGAELLIRVSNRFYMSGGTINLKGKGTVGATSGACASTNAGKAGGATGLVSGGTAGTSAGTAGGAGVSGQLQPQSFAILNGVGTGGGACPSSGQTGARTVSVWAPSLGASGGGGGGCAASCSGTCGAGGAGGGFLHIEAGNQFDWSGGTIDVSGADGATGGGGGGGGGSILVQTTDVTASYGTTVLSGGAAGASPPTNCGAGAAGGAGRQFNELDPR